MVPALVLLLATTLGAAPQSPAQGDGDLPIPAAGIGAGAGVATALVVGVPLGVLLVMSANSTVELALAGICIGVVVLGGAGGATGAALRGDRLEDVYAGGAAGVVGGLVAIGTSVALVYSGIHLGPAHAAAPLIGLGVVALAAGATSELALLALHELD